MITKLDSLTDISTEFGVPLPTAAKMNWYYDNKNPASPVQPVMGGGRIKDWIGYNHSASAEPPTYSDWDLFFNFKHFTYFREKAGLPATITSWTKMPKHQGGSPVSNSGNYINYVGAPQQLDDGIAVNYSAGKRVNGYIPITSTNIAFYMIAELGTTYQNQALLLGISTARAGSFSFGINILNTNIATWINGTYHYIKDDAGNNITLSQVWGKKCLFAISYNSKTYGSVIEIREVSTGRRIGYYANNGLRPNFLGHTQPYQFGMFTGDGISANGNIYKIAISTNSVKCLQSATITDILNEINGMG